MFRHFALFVAIFAFAGASCPAEPPAAVRVVTADGKPAAGAKVWVYEYAADEAKGTPPLVADAAGKLTLPAADAGKTRQLFARDAAGRVGHATAGGPWAEPDATGIELVLVATADRAGRVTGPDGKPIAGATITPEGYTAEARGRRTTRGPAAQIPLPKWEQDRLAVTADADGRFKLPVPAAGYSLYYRVAAAGFGESKWTAPAGVEIDTPLAVPGGLAVTISGIDPAALKGTTWRLDAAGAKSKGVQPRRWELGTCDGTARIVAPRLMPGTYTLSMHLDSGVPGVFEPPAPVEVVSGKVAEVAVTFGPTAKVTGKVTDKDGNGVGKVQLLVNVSDSSDGPSPRRQLFATTAADGTYAVHGPAGWYAVWTQTPLPDGYAPPATGTRQGQVEPAKVEVGKSHAFAPIALLKAVTFVADVKLADGSPAAGATVGTGLTTEFRRQKLVTDTGGRLAVPNLAPDDAIAPYVRLGTAVNVPETFQLEKHDRPVAIELSEANGATFKGRVTDAKGKPVAGAKVGLRHNVQGVGRNAQYSTFGATATTTTDAGGRYTFAGYWPKDRYGVVVSADGYSEAESKQLRGEAGQTHDFGDQKLTRASLTVRGVVVGPDGKPVAGAEVFSVDGTERFAATSAADGAFTLTGFFESGGFVLVKQAGFRVAAVPVSPIDGKPVTITLSKPGPQPPPEVPAAHRAAMADLTARVLTHVWDSHPTFGYGGNAIAHMARIDPPTARRWRDQEKERTAGKTDFTRHIDKADRDRTLFDTAKADPDEALGVVGGLKSEEGFTAAVKLAERLLPTDKAAALRFAEEAVVKARQRELPDRIYALAEAGDLAVRAGGAGGKKVLAEAADLAAKLDADGNTRESMAVGLVAAHLAAHDPARSDALLASLKDPSDHNRFLAAAATRVARADLTRATAMFARFKPSNSYYPQEARVRVAYAVAATHPDEAVKLVAEVKEPRYRVGGYFGLATRFAKTDKARAHKMIDAAFDLLEGDPTALRSWSNSGGRAGLAATGAVRAAEIGYPDVPHLVARCLAMRPAGRDIWSLDARENAAVNLAAVLAQVDPAVGRQLLATIAPPDEFVEKAASKGREWLFGLAFADPVRAKTLADKLIERAKAARGGRNGLSETGLVELGSILAAADRLAEFGHYGGFLREIDEWD